MSRYRALPSLFGAILLLLSGCGKDTRSEIASANQPRGTLPSEQILKIGNGSEAQDLDPQAVTGVTEHRIIAALFENLVSEDPKDLHPIPGLAESWDISADGKVYTFKLRPNLKWSNGDPILASEMVESYKRALSPKLASEYAYLIYNFVVGAKDFFEEKISDFGQVGFKAPDEQTLQVTLQNPTPYLLKIIASHNAWTPVPVKVVTKFGALDQKRTAWTRAGNLVGSGPFLLKEWSAHQRIVVTRNPNYWDAKTVRLDGIHFLPTEDISTDERNFRTGQVHMTY